MNKNLYIQKIENVEISPEQVKEITIEAIHNAFGLPIGCFIKDNNIVVEREYHTSHSWTDNEFVKKLNDTDKAVLEVIKKLNKIPANKFC